MKLRGLARACFVLASVAAVPGFVAGFLPLVGLWELARNGSSLIVRGWPLGLAMLGAMALGWWLYWTYWLELKGRNPFGKASWLVSALANGLAALLLIPRVAGSLEYGDFQEALLAALALLWLGAMGLLSSRAWWLRLRA